MVIAILIMVDYLLEVGVEELPADFVSSAISQWQERIPQSLAAEFLTNKSIEVYGTPRRLAVLIKGLPSKQPDRQEEIKGPPSKAAFKNGKPTKAATGFARKQGVAVADLELKDTPKGEFVFIQKQIQGQGIAEILPALSIQWITGLEGKRFMRWGDGDIRFPRPIRWLVALLDDTVLPVELVNGSETLKSDRISRGHRVLHPESISLPQAADYVEALRQGFVEVDSALRKHKIEQQVKTVAKEIGGSAEIDPELLEEVTNLVEYPNAVAGSFETAFLDLPTEVITTVMVTHQRYFPIKQQGSDNLLPDFITISNGDPKKSQVIAEGNNRVIRARLADAQFFYKADCDEHLDTYLPQLEAVTFQAKLGTMRDKVDRIMEVANAIASQLEVTEEQEKEIENTALLCKADLVTQMVYEFPELQGVMGEKYALVSGETTTVAKGIFEHYLPRGADDIMPETLNGQVVGLADRLDTLVGIFGLGMIPSGSSDPFALRRAANAVINIIWYANLEVNIKALIEQGAHEFLASHQDQESPVNALQEFFRQRIRTLLQDEKNLDYDLVNAILGEDDEEYTARALEDILDARDRALFLQEIRQNNQLHNIYETVNRSTRLAVQGELDTQQLDPQEVVNCELFESPTEEAFYNALVALVPQTESALENRNYQLLVDGLSEIVPTVSEFFDGENSVLVMAEDENIKRNRLNLLGLLRNHARVLADFGAIVKS